MLAVVAAIVFGVAIFFKVTTIEVQGNTLYSAEDVIAASGIEPGDNLLLVNKATTAGNILAALEQQRLDHAARARLATDQAGRHHTRLVNDKHIARLDIVDDVAEDAVLNGTAVLQRRSRLRALTIHHQQAAGVARLGRSLGDQFLRKVVVKIIGTHRHVGYSLYR